MTAVATESLIKPHGGELVDRIGDRPDKLDTREVVTLTSREVSDLDMIASGALSPLEGFMGRADYERVVEEMHLVNGLPWALPVCLAVDSAPAGDRVALADESGRLLAVLDVAEVYEYDKEREAENCFRTIDDAHPGVARLYAQKPKYLAGRVTVFDRPEPSFPELARDRGDRSVLALLALGVLLIATGLLRWLGRGFALRDSSRLLFGPTVGPTFWNQLHISSVLITRPDAGPVCVTPMPDSVRAMLHAIEEGAEDPRRDG